MDKSTNKIQILIVEDSFVYQEYYRQLFMDKANLQIASILSSGEEAISQILTIKPDIVLMDFVLPGLDGLITTKKIMEVFPTSIIIVSANLHRDSIENTFSALGAGAIALIEKPGSVLTVEGKKQGIILVETLEQIAKAKLFKHTRDLKHKPKKLNETKVNLEKIERISYVVIGSSTGGPDALQKLLSKLPSHFPFPILIVQHITKGFLPSLISWLGKATKLKVEVATDRLIPQDGTVYFAPDSHQMGIKNGKIWLEKQNNLTLNCPSVSFLFTSMIPYAPNCITILLTGMGHDGVKEMEELKQKGSYTIIQDEESSVIYGMPQEAKKINAHCYEGSPVEIGLLLKTWITQ